MPTWEETKDMLERFYLSAGLERFGVPPVGGSSWGEDLPAQAVTPVFSIFLKLHTHVTLIQMSSANLADCFPSMLCGRLDQLG